jgi:crotonobetainyl-CoA:carnitine CoA-transferase CaiB-like acyl-CoA transferase
MRTGAWTRIGRRHSGEETMAAPPFRFDGVRPAVGRPAPLLGEHSDIVLGPLRTEAV